MDNSNNVLGSSVLDNLDNLDNSDLDKTIVNTDTIIQTTKVSIDVIPNPEHLEHLETTIINDTNITNITNTYRDVVGEDNINNSSRADMTCAGDIVSNLDEQQKKKLFDYVDNNNEKIVAVADVGAVADVVDSEHGGIVYDLIHLLDDVYSYGRTIIENNYFNFANNDDFNLIYPNIYIGNYSTSTNLELLKGVGITHILSVIPTFNPPFLDKFTYLHIPAYDDQSQDLKQDDTNADLPWN